MNTSRITERVYYIGVNDRSKDRFESMWPLPYGVSYNSYLVVGEEKCAVIDGVESSFAGQQIEEIKSILGDRKPDYLIINHMEPDHSSGIRALRKEFPDIRIVGNAQTLNMVKGFYGVDCNTQAVKDGETLSLGPSESLTFYLTPMVHWPETMMTYFADEKVLFSGDGFGCFGALNGAVIDTEMDTERYFPEMVRYYSNIVGKYGIFVQRALQKLSSLDIETICSTHGPVWRDQRGKVGELYNTLSLYRPLDEGVSIIYGSMYGNTERAAEEAAKVLSEQGIRRISVMNAAKVELSEMLAEIFRHRGLILAAPTYSDTLFPPMRTVVEAIATRGVVNRELLIFGGCTWAMRSVNVMSEILSGAGITPMEPPAVWKQSPGAEAMGEIRRQCIELASRLNSMPGE